MSETVSRVRELAAKLDQLGKENISLAGHAVLSQCRNLCVELGEGQVELWPSLQAGPRGWEEQKSVMVVDDDEDTIRVVQFVLQRAGFSVHVVPALADVIAAMDRIRPDVVLIDLVLAQSTNFELLSQIKAHPVHCASKIIVGSSRTFNRDRLAVLRLGASDFVPKPFHVEELVLRVRSLAG